MAHHLLALATSAVHIPATPASITYTIIYKMYPEIFYPMAPRNSVPRICRRYHYQHNPPPSHPTEFAGELRRRLRGVEKRRGLWDKVKSVAWRFMRECMAFSANSMTLTRHS